MAFAQGVSCGQQPFPNRPALSTSPIPLCGYIRPQMGYLPVLWMSGLTNADALLRPSRQSIAILPDTSSVDAIRPGHYAFHRTQESQGALIKVEGGDVPGQSWGPPVSARKVLPSIYRGKGFVIAARA